MAGPPLNGPFVPYVIRNGEYLSKVAMKLGFDADAVWNHEKNREIHDLRKGKSNLLCSGDVVLVPKSTKKGLPLANGTANRYVANVPSTTFDMHFNGDDGPLANESYTYTIEGVEETGTTDGDGKATFTVPITCAEVDVEFASKGIEVKAKVGHLDPIEEPSGVWQRLKNHAYIASDPSGNDSDDAATLAKAIRSFQHDQKLKITGKIDDAFTAKLTDLCKS